MFKKMLALGVIMLGSFVGTMATPDTAEARPRYRGGYYGGYYSAPRYYGYSYGYRPRYYSNYYYSRPYYGYGYGRPYYYGGGWNRYGGYGSGVYIGRGGVSIGW